MILHVIGARPNCIKASPLIRELKSRDIKQLVVHTSQHYSNNMSRDIMSAVGMDEPDIFLPILKEDPIKRLAFMIDKLYEVLTSYSPHTVIVYGDVDSTLAAALATKKYGAKLAHIEAGLRSFDESMPEEINRRLVDEVADICFTTEQSGIVNLKHHSKKVFLVGNTMIDTLVWVQNQGLLQADNTEDYVLLTVHRPSNVDNEHSLKKIIAMCQKIDIPIIWPLHPRTKTKMEHYNVFKEVITIKHLKIIEPLAYVPFLNYINNSIAVITDSGGVQEETTFLRVPCLTIRKNTERPSTIDLGTNMLVEIENVAQTLEMYRKYPTYSSNIPPLWDGRASKRIVDTLLLLGFNSP